MENNYVVSGLTRKRAELAGILEDARARVQRIETDLDCLDRTIRLLRPNFAVEAIRPKAIRGECKSRCRGPRAPAAWSRQESGHLAVEQPLDDADLRGRD